MAAGGGNAVFNNDLTFGMTGCFNGFGLGCAAVVGCTGVSLYAFFFAGGGLGYNALIPSVARCVNVIIFIGVAAIVVTAGVGGIALCLASGGSYNPVIAVARCGDFYIGCVITA